MVRLIVACIGVISLAGCAESVTPEQRQRALLFISHCIEEAGPSARVVDGGIEILADDDIDPTEIDQIYDQCSEPYWDLITVE